ncbi:MAG: CCA tRNA nucleotidyltransferase [Alphaproteobacteria bacterium]|nr:CCA tRNA nucleotidyltransferase [Alphaproteobacteria bacterium]
MRLSSTDFMTPASERIFDAIRTAGGEVRYVGGCVRDALLKRSGADVDMATTLSPEAVLKALQTADIFTIATGLEHGTITAISHGKAFEITTLRRDIACDGRHAEVAFSENWQEDAARRDFTMNALYMAQDGTVYDYFDGIADAQRGIVRFIGDPQARIAEDGLRILRLFRFYAHYGVQPIAKEDLRACAANASMLRQLSGERIQNEMLKLLSAPQDKVVKALEYMQQAQLLAHIACDVVDIQTLATLPVEATQPLVRLAALLHNGDSAEAVMLRWKLSNKDKAFLRGVLPVNADAMAQWDEWMQKKILRQQSPEQFVAQVQIAMALRPEHVTHYKHMLNLADSWHIPEFPVTGRDLLALGLEQSKQLGQWLHK